MGSEWQETTLGDIASKSGFGLVDGPFGSNLPASCYTPSGIPVIRGSNLSLGTDRFRSTEFVYVSPNTAKRLERSLCGPLDIIFTKKGTLGQTGLIPEKGKYAQYLISSNQMKLTVERNIAYPLFVYYYVSSRSSVDKILQDSEATGVPKTNVAYLRNFPITLPPLPEQKAIAHILGSLDDKIELNRRMNATLEGMAQALFRSWFVDFDPVIDNALAAGNPLPDELAERAEVRSQALADGTANWEAAQAFPAAFQRSEELGWIPEGWTVKKADEIAKITIGKTPPRKESHWFSDNSSGNIVWASIRDMGNCGAFIGDSNEYLTPESIGKFNIHVIPEGSVILSFKLTIGRVAITQRKMTTNEAIAHFVNPKFGLTKEFLYCYLTSFDFSSLGSTSSIATAVNSKIIKGMPFLIPNRTCLDNFKRTTQIWFESISNNTVQAQTLAALRDTLLPQLISGDLRLPDGATLAEEVLA